MHATLPHLGGSEERRALFAGTSFLDLTVDPNLPVEKLARWFDESVVAPGFSPRLSILLEPAAGSVALRATSERSSLEMARVVTTARARIVASLRGYIGTPADDRFLRAAIFLGRVRRHDSHWQARPEATAPLSGIVLSLFAAAILSERSFYDHNLCVCEACGRVSFDPTPAMRRYCALHAPGMSGMHPLAVPPDTATGQ